MRNLPAAWTSASASPVALHANVKDLLGKFGELEGEPVISRTPEGACAIVRFTQRAAALAAVDMLHGRDNRVLPRGAKWSADYRPPREGERFEVLVAAAARGGVAAAAAAGVVQRAPASAVGAAGVEATRRLLLSELPPDWGLKDVEELCDQYGDLSEVGNVGPRKFSATYATPKAAERAALALSGLQVPGQDGVFSVLRCEILASGGSRAASHLPVQPPPGAATARPQVAAVPVPTRPPALVKPPSPPRPVATAIASPPVALPAQQPSPPWLPTPAPSARFQIEDPDEGLTVFEEVALSVEEKIRKEQLAEAAAREAKAEAKRARKRELEAKAKASMEAEEEAKRRKRDDSGKLEKDAEFNGAGRAPSMVGPHLVIRGFPASWTTAQVRLVLAVFGGVAAVEFLSDGGQHGGREAHVKLKELERTARAAEQLNNAVVGDGSLIERCTLRCAYLDGGPAAPRGPASYGGPGHIAAGGVSPPGPPLHGGYQLFAWPRALPPPGSYAAAYPIDPYRCAPLAGYPAHAGPRTWEPPPVPGQASAQGAAEAERGRRRRRRREEVPAESPLRASREPEAARAAGSSGEGSGAAQAAGAAAAAASHEARVRAEISQGVSLIREARALAEDEQLQEAYAKYLSGLQRLLKVDKTEPQIIALQGKIAQYVEEAERLKERTDGEGNSAGSGGAARGGSSPSAGPAAAAAPAPAAAGAAEARSCSRRHRSRRRQQQRRCGAEDGTPEGCGVRRSPSRGRSWRCAPPRPERGARLVARAGARGRSGSGGARRAPSPWGGGSRPRGAALEERGCRSRSRGGPRGGRAAGDAAVREDSAREDEETTMQRSRPLREDDPEPGDAARGHRRERWQRPRALLVARPGVDG